MTKGALTEMNLHRGCDLAAPGAAAALVARNSNPKRSIGITTELKSGKFLVKIFAEGEDLKISAQHFRMEQGLEGAFFRSAKVGVWKKFRNNPREKMMLVGKTD